MLVCLHFTVASRWCMLFWFRLCNFCIYSSHVWVFLIAKRIIFLSRHAYVRLHFVCFAFAAGVIQEDYQRRSAAAPGRLCASIPQGQAYAMHDARLRSLILAPRVAISPINPGMKSHGTRAVLTSISLSLHFYFCRVRSVTMFQSNFQFP